MFRSSFCACFVLYLQNVPASTATILLNYCGQWRKIPQMNQHYVHIIWRVSFNTTRLEQLIAVLIWIHVPNLSFLSNRRSLDHKTCLIPPLYIEVPVIITSQECGRSCILSLSTSLLLDLGTVPTAWYF